MGNDKPNAVLFRLVFFGLFIVTLFMPVFPLYKGTMYIGSLPLWAIYASVLFMPEWLLFTLPCIHTHFWLNYQIAHRVTDYKNARNRFTIAHALLLTTVVALGLALTMAYGPIGFVTTYAIFWLGRWLAWLSGRFGNSTSGDYSGSSTHFPSQSESRS